MGNFNKKKFLKNLFPFGDKRENTLKTGPEGNGRLWGLWFFFQTPEG